MSKFNIGDILKSKNPNFSDNKYVHVLVLCWTDSNEWATPVYTVFDFDTGVKHQWNSNHVDIYYERLS